MITIGRTAHNTAIGFDLDSLLVTRLLIQANSGAGKSYLLRVLMEQLFGHIQIIAIDPEGEFATAREKFGFVLVGKGGETPADVRSAEMLAERLLEIRASAICDLYEMKKPDRHLWVQKFLDAMIAAPKKLWHPVAIIVDEAHLFCPEKGQGESVAHSAMVDLATRGRKRGFCAIWATQRLSKLDKNASAELLNRLVGGTFEDLDTRRALEMLSVPSEERRAFAERLKTIEPGEFFAFGRAIARERTLFKVSLATTTHPKSGSAKHAAEPPPTPDQVQQLLPQLADLPQEAVERAQTVAELRTRIRDLERELKQKPAVSVVSPVKDDRKLRAVIQYATKLEKDIAELQGHAQTIAQRAGEVIATTKAGISSLADDIARYKLPRGRDVAQAMSTIGDEAQKFSESGPVVTPAAPPRPKPATQYTNLDIPRLKAGAREMLRRLLQFPDGLTRTQLAAMTGFAEKGGTFREYFRSLQAEGLIMGINGHIEIAPGQFERTVAIVGSLPDAPATTEDVKALWRPRLKAGAFQMLEILIQSKGRPIAKQDLGRAAGFEASGGTFREYLRLLTRAGLAVQEGANVKANEATLLL